jgi:nucleotide-binding universal stress UspA family protein
MTLPLDTAPGPSPDAESQRNAAISRNFLRQAREELATGDLLQASEKSWGAAAHAVKAAAEKRRWFSEADWKLRRVVNVIAAEQGDNDIVAYYLTARDAHFNFYHHEFDYMTVEYAINAAADLVAKLEAARVRQGEPPYVSETVEAAIRSLEQPTSEPDRERLEKGRPPMEQRPAALPPETVPDTDVTQA